MLSMEGERAAQSAMEYLMTYGWAILIILIVLAVLYIIGVFTPTGILGNQCNVQFKYSCTGPTLSTNGSVSFLLGQNTGTNQYNIAVACTSAMNSTGGPLPANAWVYLNASGAPKSSYISGSAYELDSGTFIQVNNTPCYSSTGAPLGSQSYGTAFTGMLWLRYTINPSTPASVGNPYVLVRLADLSVTVGRSGVGGGSGGSSSTTLASSSTSTSTTSIPAVFATASKSTANLSLSVKPSSYSTYLCAGVASGGSTSPFPGITAGWSTDVKDNKTGGPYSSIGHSSTGCSATTSGTKQNLTIAAIGLNGTPTYSSFFATDNPGNGYANVAYTVASSNSFTVLIGTCGFEHGPCEAVNLPSGCTERQNLLDPVGYDNVYIATCQNQQTGTVINFNYSISCIATRTCLAQPACQKVGPCPIPVTAGVYVFPNYAPTGS